MFRRIAVPRLLALTLVLLAGLAGLSTGLSAQDATTASTVAPTPVTSGPVSEASAAPTPVGESGPRVVQPLERYQPSLSPGEATERPTVASGGNHTIVLSTLALVLIVVIVVLLVVN